MAILFTLTLFIVTFRLRSMWHPVSAWTCQCGTQCQSERSRRLTLLLYSIFQDLPLGIFYGVAITMW